MVITEKTIAEENAEPIILSDDIYGQVQTLQNLTASIDNLADEIRKLRTK